MKKVVMAVVIVAFATPAFAQLGGVLDKAQRGLKRVEQAQKFMITDAEEQQIGADVSGQIRLRFGVVQDKAIHTYVTQVGLLLAKASSRGDLPWRFIVLDTDGVNAFASPGGFIHITRGALALIQNEAELAGVLGHEITHVTEKHTINAIRKNKALQLGADRAGGDKRELISAISGRVYDMVIENSFDRGDENEADQKGVALAASLGYAPSGLADFLARLADRNRNQKERNGLFASHPEMKERLSRIRNHASAHRSANATVAARYKAHVKYEPTELADVPQATAGSAGLAGGSSSKSTASEKTAEQPKKKGLNLELLKPTSKAEGQSAQVSSSGGARGVGPDRNAKGGPNPEIVTVVVSPTELATFRRGIA